MSSNTTLADFIWKNAADLWGNFKHTDLGKIILPFTPLRRLECVLEPTREQVRETFVSMKDSGIDLEVILRTQTGHPFCNISNYDLRSLGATRTRQNLEDYIASFSDNTRVIFVLLTGSDLPDSLNHPGPVFGVQAISARSCHSCPSTSLGMNASLPAS